MNFACALLRHLQKLIKSFNLIIELLQMVRVCNFIILNVRQLALHVHDIIKTLHFGFSVK